MATKIVTKNSSTAGAAPTASDLVQGELAVNVVDKKLYTEDNAGAVVLLADGVKLAGIEALADVTDTTNVTAAGALMDSELTSIASVKALDQGVATTDSPTFAAATVTGEITANGGITFGDNDKATFGAGDDLKVYHSGATGLIENYTGSLVISNASDDYDVIIQSDNGAGSLTDYFRADGSAGSALLYHYGSAKLATTSTGIDVTGTATMDGAEIDVTRSNTAGSGFLTLDLVGTSGDFAHRVDASNAYYLDYYTGSAWRPTIKIEGQTGDISFYEDTGTTPKLFWDASAESLGIGTSSPSANLEVSGSDPSIKVSQVGGPGHATLSLASIGSGGRTYNIISGDNAYSSGSGLHIEQDNGLQVTMQAGGNVGIGTSSPSALLDLKDTAPKIRLTDERSITWSGGETLGELEFYTTDGSSPNGTKTASFIKSINTSSSTVPSGELVFGVSQGSGTSANATEAMRIDASGNLLVGKTSNSIDTVGGLIRANGQIGGCADGNYAGVFSRNTSDGSIVLFRKDSATLGSIGTASSGDLYIADGRNAGIKLDGGNNQVLPVNSAGSSLDATLDLGTSGAAFKDLYLSGGVYLGGTGDANKLDDYEKGTWNPKLKGEGGGETGNIGTGYYTKVGRVVHLSVYVNATIDTTGLSGLINISNLPFTPTAWEGGGTISYATSFTTLDEEDTTFLLRPFSGSTFRITKGSSVNWLNAGNINTGAMAFMLEGWFIS